MAKLTLKAARVNSGLTQKEAADMFEISNKTLSYWESGKTFPSADKIPMICEAYGCSYDDLIFLPNNPL